MPPCQSIAQQFKNTLEMISFRYWGEPERAPHRRVCCKFSIYIYIYISVVRRAASQFLLLFCVCQTYICCTSCCKSLPAPILCIPLSSCVISKTTRTVWCSVKARRTVTQMDGQRDRGTRMLDLRFLC